MEAGAALLEPLFDDDPDRGGRHAENKTREPQRVEQDRVEGSLEWWLRRAVEGGSGRVDKWRIELEALELRGDARQYDVRLVSWRWPEELVELDVEDGQDDGEETSLFGAESAPRKEAHSEAKILT